MSTILIVLTSHATLGSTGRPTGFSVSEAAEPWRAFTAAGHTAELASVAGGTPPADGSGTASTASARPGPPVRSRASPTRRRPPPA